ncbi:MAG TPA: two-component regulator propeller domain-containing protein [Candidatus Limnocylindrales bacterium]|nr:two-component regulator propeller domain-containing protein [Candidatus Limnocylindrales bacterium]
MIVLRTRVVLRELLGKTRERFLDLLVQKLPGLAFNTPGLTAALSLFILLLLLPNASAALPETQTSHWLITSWETDNGLPENSATAMVQAPDGYLWFGTFKGLVRFDGVSFTVFNHANTPQLPDDGVVNVHLDHSGRLWVSTLGGLVLHDGEDWSPIGAPTVPATDPIRTFTERPNGDLLLTTFQGKVFEFATNRLTELPTPPGESGAGYLGGVDEEGHWWVAQSKYVGRWSAREWQPILAADELKTTSPSRIMLAPARGGGLWLLLASELRKYSRGVEVARRRLSVLPGNVWSMTEDTRSNIWICTFDQGLTQLLPDDHIMRWTEQNGLSYHGTRFVYEDHERNLWVGSSGGGLQRFKPRRFESFGPLAGLSERVVKSVCPAPDGGIWIATYGDGLFRLTDTGLTNVPLTGWTNLHLYGQSVLSDRTGRTWVGTFGSGLFRFDANGCQRFPAEITGGDNVIALFEDSRGRIWMSGGRGVSVFEQGEFLAYGPEQGLPKGAVYCFAEDKQQAIWLSNQEGVFRSEKGRFSEIHDVAGKPLSGITCLKGESDGTMWMGSMGNGLMRWREGKLSKISVSAGLPVAHVYGILQDAQGCFWMSSNRGIMRARRTDLNSVADGTAAKLVCQLLDLNDGLPSVECPSGQQPSCARDERGRLWFSTIKGVAVTDPAAFQANTLAPLAHIEEVVFYTGSRNAVANEEVQHIRSPFSEKFELPAGCHGIEIHYTAPSFCSPAKVAFQIKLDTPNSEWRDVGNRRVAYFDQLAAGRHVFQVRAANDDGLWSDTGASLAFTVLPFFWQTDLFLGLMIVCLCALVLAWLAHLKSRMESKHAAQRAFTRQLILSQENERKRIASELHDGLGQDLLLVKNRLGLLSAKATPDLARQLSEISSTTARAIADVREISHALRPSALEQVGLTKAIEWMVEQMAETSQVKFSAELDNIDHLLAPEMEINMYRIVQEALNNVIKHAAASQVIVETKRGPNEITVSVFDDGRGFDLERLARNGERRSGLGLVSMEERTKVLGGEIKIKSELSVGTRLILNVPLAKAEK